MALSFEEALRASTLVFDGATGTEIYRRNVFTNQCYDELNLRNRKMIKEIAKAAGGGGGGKADMAQAGAKDASRIGDAFAKAKELLG